MPRSCVAIDFDSTFSALPETWTYIVDRLAYVGVLTICATNRDDTDLNRDLLQAVLPKGMQIVFCGNRYKREVCEAAGFDVWVVIDDQPEAWVPRPEPIWLVRLVGALKSLCFWKR